MARSSPQRIDGNHIPTSHFAHHRRHRWPIEYSNRGKRAHGYRRCLSRDGTKASRRLASKALALANPGAERKSS